MENTALTQTQFRNKFDNDSVVKEIIYKLSLVCKPLPSGIKEIYGKNDHYNYFLSLEGKTLNVYHKKIGSVTCSIQFQNNRLKAFKVSSLGNVKKTCYVIGYLYKDPLFTESLFPNSSDYQPETIVISKTIDELAKNKKVKQNNEIKILLFGLVSHIKKEYSQINYTFQNNQTTELIPRFFNFYKGCLEITYSSSKSWGRTQRRFDFRYEVLGDYSTFHPETINSIFKQ